MKHCISWIGMCLVLGWCSACSREDAEEAWASVGYLKVTEARIVCEEEHIPLTRAVDPCLRLQLWQEGKIVKEYAPGAAELSKRIALPAGNYTLKAFTPLQQEAANNEPGTPIGELTRDFTVVAGDLTTLSPVVVPQQNVGVKLVVSREIQTYFPQCSLEIASKSGRKVTLTHASLVSPFYYFDLPKDQQLTYTLSLINADNESHVVSKVISQIVSPRNYIIQVEIAQGEVRSKIRESV